MNDGSLSKLTEMADKMIEMAPQTSVIHASVQKDTTENLAVAEVAAMKRNAKWKHGNLSAVDYVPLLKIVPMKPISVGITGSMEIELRDVEALASIISLQTRFPLIRNRRGGRIKNQ